MLINVINNVQHRIGGILPHLPALRLTVKPMEGFLHIQAAGYKFLRNRLHDGGKQSFFIFETYINGISACFRFSGNRPQGSIRVAFFKELLLRTFQYPFIHAFYLLRHPFTSFLITAFHNTVSIIIRKNTLVKKVSKKTACAIKLPVFLRITLPSRLPPDAYSPPASRS